MLVQVMKKHIEEGVQGVDDQCPIALALFDMGYEGVLVDSYKALVMKGGTRVSYRLPIEARRFVVAYDHSTSPESFEPFQFILD